MHKILVIENDNFCRENFSELLTLLGYQVEAYDQLSSIEKGQKSLAEHIRSFSVVVADTDSVDIDALKLKAILNNDFSRVPLILISADKVPLHSLDKDELSAISFLRKPFDNYLLEEYICKALQLRELFIQTVDNERAIAKLILRQPGKLVQEYSLRRSYSLGRFRQNDKVHADICLNSPNASRKHSFLVRVYRKNEIYYKLVDFSSNGIIVNGHRINEIIKLNHNDVIKFYSESTSVYTEIDKEKPDLDRTLF